MIKYIASGENHVDIEATDAKARPIAINENLGKNNLSSGWKIHISSTGDNGLEVLEKVTG